MKLKQISIIALLFTLTFGFFGPALGADTYTPILNMTLPGPGSPAWGSKLNDNFSTLDSSYGTIQTNITDAPEVYSYSDTFNSTTGTIINLPKSVTAVTEYSVAIIATSRASTIGDIYVMKGLASFTVLCSAANTADTFIATIYYEGDLNAYGASFFRRWFVSPTSGDHADTSFTGGLAYCLNQIGSNYATVICPGNFTYQLKQDLTIGEKIQLIMDRGAILDKDFSLIGSSYKWTLSGSGTAEYYLEASGGGNPSLPGKPSHMVENNSEMTEATAGSLAASEWDWTDNDSLGFTTVYVRLSDDTDPDTKAQDYLENESDLFINGPFGVGRYQVFTRTAVPVAFGINNRPKLFPEWWGATSNDSIANAVVCYEALQATTDLAGSMTFTDTGDFWGAGVDKAGVVSLAYGTYRYDGHLTSTRAISIEGTGTGSILLAVANGGTALEIKPATYTRASYFRNFALKANATGNKPVIGLHWSGEGTGRTGLKMDNVEISRFNTDTTGKGMYLQNGVGATLDNCLIYGNYDGIVVGAADVVMGTTLAMRNCVVSLNGNGAGAKGNAIEIYNQLGFSIVDSIIESNYGNGIYCAPTNTEVIQNLNIRLTHFENNARNIDSDATNRYSDILVDPGPDTARHITIRDNYFLSGQGITANIVIDKDGTGGNWYTDVSNNHLCHTTGAQALKVNEFTFNDNGANPDTITSATYDFVANDYTAWQYVEILGSVSNDKIVYVTAVAANTLTLPTGSLNANEAPTATKETLLRPLNMVCPTSNVAMTVNNNTTLRAPQRCDNVIATSGLALSKGNVPEGDNVPAGATGGTFYFKTTMFGDDISADGATWYTIAKLRNVISAMPAVVHVFGVTGVAREFYDVVPFSYNGIGTVITTENFASGAPARSYQMSDTHKLQLQLADPGGTPDFSIRVIGLGDLN